MYIDKLDDIVNKFNNTYHTSIKMKPADVKPHTYVSSSQEVNDKDPKFKTGDTVRISKCKNIFAKGYVANWPEEVFLIKKVKSIVPWAYFFSDFKDEKVKKVINRKGYKLYVKWKGYNSSFNSWIDKKNHSINE